MKYYNLPRFIIILRWALSTEVQPWRTMCLQQPQGEDEQVQVLSLLKEWVWLSENTSEHPHKSTWNPHDIYIYIYISADICIWYIFLLNQGEPITKRAPQHHLSRYRSAFRGIRVQPMFATLLPGGGPEKTGEPERWKSHLHPQKPLKKPEGIPSDPHVHPH